MASSGQFQTWMDKMSSSDADFRFMALNDLMGDLSTSTKELEDYIQKKLSLAVLKLLDDSQSTVQNLAIKCLSLLMKKLGSGHVQDILDSLLNLISPKSRAELREVAGIALKTVVMEVPEEEFQSGSFTKRLVPKLLQMITDSQDMQDQTLFDSLDILTKVLSRLDASQMTQNSKTLELIQVALWKLLEHSRAAIRKRAIASYTPLVPLLSDEAFGNLVQKKLLKELVKAKKAQSTDRLATLVSLISVIGRSDATRLGPHLKDILPLLLELSRLHDNEDLVEYCLQALEAFTLKCSPEITSFLGEITRLAVESLQYDPNYNDEESNESEMDVDDAENSEDEEEEEEEDDYSDDEDMSWKIRKSAAKLLSALFCTRTDYLADFYSNAASVLVMRFKERVESVRVEIISAFTTLVTQSGLVMDHRRKRLVRKLSSLVHTQSAKKRRSESGSIATATTTHSTHQALATLVVHVVKQISRHFLPKITSLPTALADYTLLKDIASIAPDVLEPHLDKLNSIFDVTFSSSSGSNANLRFAMLELMNTMLSSFSDGSLYLPLSQKIMKPVLVAANEKFTKVAKEAILVVISLLQVLRPIEATDIKPGPVTNPQIVQSLNQIFDFTIAKCISSDLELEVKEQALLCLGAVVYHAADLIPPASISGQVIPLLLDRLQNESYRLMTIKVISNILVSPFDKSLVDFTPVLSPMLTELSSFLRKAHRQLKLSSLQCLELLLNRYHEVPKDVLEPLMSDLNVLMRESDLHIVSRTIALLTVVIKSFSSNKFVIKEVKSELIPTLISVMVENPHLLVNGPGAGNLTTFWDAVWEAGDLSLHDACLTLLAKTGKSDKNSRQTFSVIAKSMAILASRGEKDWMLKLVNTWLKELKKASPAQQHLSLIALGEVGSRVDLTLDVADLFSIVFGYFSSPSEEVKYAAAFALGNISLGNVEKSLPSILDAIRKNDTQRFLLFITLKEVISKLASVSVAPEHLRKVAPDIWSLLIQNLDSVDEDTVRNAIAECLGKISLFDPNTYMPQLQSQIKSEKTVVKSTAITAVRFTLTDTLVQQDEFELVLTPLLHDILSIPQDADTLVVRMALSTLTSAAHNKPNLVKRMIGQVCTFVYYSTVVRKELIQMVDFGPFKHRVDDGLEARKAAFEFMDTLLDSCLPSIEIYEFIAHVVSGLADESDEIKIIAFLMLQRLTQLHPKAVAQKLDLVIAPLKACLTRKLKENAVKQELERTKDLKRAATRCCVLVSNVAHDSPTFSAFIEEMKAASPELQELFTSVTTEVTGGHGMMRNKSVDMMEF